MANELTLMQCKHHFKYKSKVWKLEILWEIEKQRKGIYKTGACASVGALWNEIVKHAFRLESKVTEQKEKSENDEIFNLLLNQKQTNEP